MSIRAKLIGFLLVMVLLVVACRQDDEPEAEPTEVPAVESAKAPAEKPEEEMGILDGMTAEELQDAGYVVIAPGDPIRIGISAALTGPIPDPGRDIANGAEIGIDDLNAAGGLEGHLYEGVLEDGACDGDQGTVVGNKFAADPSIVAVSGGTCTGETLGLKPILQDARIAFVSPSATNPAITSEECDVCNRVALNDKLQGDTDAEYVVNTLGIVNVAIMHDNSDYGLGLAELFRTHFEELGGAVTSFEGVQVGDTDFRPVLLEISTDNPDLIFFGGYATEAGLIDVQMDEVGLGDAVFFSDDGAYTKQYLDVAGAAAEGSYASFVSGDEVADANAEFDAKYAEKYGVSPDDMGPFHAQSYDSVLLLGDAIARTATATEEGYLLINREELLTAIRGTSDLQGLTGQLTCSAIGDCGAGGIQVYKVTDGSFVQVSGFGLEEVTVVEEAGLYLGMTEEELADAGYVVIAPGDPIRIGISAALTGPIPDPGRDIANGAEIGIDDLNAAGGLEGHQYEGVVEDGACDGDQGTVVGNKFAADPSIVAVSGGTCTGETLGLKPILQDARIPFVSPSATNPAITSEECDVCNRVALNDKLQGDTDAEYVVNILGIVNVAIMHDNSDYGLGLAELFGAHFEELGGTVTSFEGVQVGDTDFRPVLLEISTDNPDLIFFGGYATEAGLIDIQMDEVGLGDAVFFSDDGAYTKQYLDVAGAAAEGSYASFVSGDEVADANAEFDAKYEEKFGVTPDEMGPFHAQAYDSILLLGDAIARAAIVTEEGYLLINREELLTVIRETSDLVGLTGILTCSAIGDCGAGGIQIYQVIDGAFEQISGIGLEE